jgi:hypothetical protein
LPALLEIFFDQFDADYESYDLSDFGGAKGTASISFNQTELSLKIFANRWGCPTLVHSISGTDYRQLGIRRRSIISLSRDRTISNSCEMDPCTGRW